MASVPETASLMVPAAFFEDFCPLSAMILSTWAKVSYSFCLFPSPNCSKNTAAEEVCFPIDAIFYILESPVPDLFILIGNLLINKL